MTCGKKDLLKKGICERILSAFPEYPRPHKRVLEFDIDLQSKNYLCRYDHRAKPYTEIPDKDYLYDVDAFCCLKGRTFQYFLPGFLLCFLRTEEPEWSYMISSFTLAGSSINSNRNKLASLSDEQRQCVMDFLRFFRDEVETDTYLYRRIEKALSSIVQAFY
jgi:hypothetical protein